MVTPSKVLQIAAREIGYKESPAGSNSNKFGRWYGWDYQPWCAMFVSYCFYNAGLKLPITTSKGFAYCPYGVKWFKDNGKWSNAPEVGDVVFYDWGAGLLLTQQSKPQVLCISDTIGGSEHTLSYESVWSNAGFECKSQTIGLTCKNSNGQGFFLSREKWNIF